MGRSPVGQGSAAAEEQVLAFVREHAGDLLHFARRFSLCVEDAQDAYQRTLEKLVRRMRTEPPEHPLNWVRTVLRHEALAIRAEREQTLGRLALEDERHRDLGALDPAERVERFERLAHTAEALRGLKPQEMTALALRAEGLSYKEICARTGWSYTRCNRAVSEGRRALLERLQAIESGAECERWLPLLSLLADGEASARELAQLRPHLRACPACRATLRGFHAAPHQLAALLPTLALPGLAGVVGVGAGAGAAGVARASAGAAGVASTATGAAGIAGAGASGATGAGAAGAGAAPGAVEDGAANGFGLGRHLEAALHGLTERANSTVLRFHSALDALPSAKLAAVAASTVAVAGGGAAIEQAATAGGSKSGTASAAVVAPGPSSAATATPISTGSPPSSATPPTAAGGSSPQGAATTASITSTGASASANTGRFAEFALEPLASVTGAGSAAAGVFAASTSSAASSAVTAASPTPTTAAGPNFFLTRPGGRSQFQADYEDPSTVDLSDPSAARSGRVDPAAAGTRRVDPTAARPGRVDPAAAQSGSDDSKTAGARSTDPTSAPRTTTHPPSPPASRPEFPTRARSLPAPAPRPSTPPSSSQPSSAADSGAEFPGP